MSLHRDPMPSPNWSSRGGSTVTHVVLHTAEGALTYQSLGNYFASPSAGVSSHTGIDDTPGVVGEYVRRDGKAWTASNANPWSVQAELCAFAAWSTDEWFAHPVMLSNAAAWVAEESAALGIPLDHIAADAQNPAARGVCQHNDLGSMGGGHWDCGPGFPIGHVLDLARGGGGTAAQPRPVFYSTAGQGGPMVTLFHPSDPWRADDVWIGPSDDPVFGPVLHRWYTGEYGWSQVEDLGGQARSVSASWKHDGSQFRIVCDGIDGAYENVHDVAAGVFRGWTRLDVPVHG